MLRKKRRRKRAKDNIKEKKEMTIQAKEVVGLIFFFLGLFVYLSTQYPDTTGLVGYWCVGYIGKNIFGVGIMYLPIFLIFGAGSFFIAYKDKYQPAIMGLVAAFISCIIYLEFSINGVLESLSLAIPTNGGGLVGVVGAYMLFHSLGTYGSLIFLLATVFISSVLVFNFSVRGTAVALYSAYNYLRPEPAEEETKEELQKIPPIPKEAITQQLEPATQHKSFGKRLFNTLFYSETEVPILRKQPPSKPVQHIMSEAETEKEDLEEVVDLPTISKDVMIKQNKQISEEIIQDASNYVCPPLDLLDKPSKQKNGSKKHLEDCQEKAKQLEETLASFNVGAKVVNISPGPSVTRYELKPGQGVKISKITGLAQDIALKLAAPSVRIQAPIPGKALVGIEVPNPSVDIVKMRTIVDKTNFMQEQSKLNCTVGLTITGEPIVMELNKMPHLLIAGATGSGKSVCINSIILSILLRARPDEVKFLMIDPKKVELSLYEGIPHLLAPVVTNPHMAAATLKQWALVEMENRYEEFTRVGVKEILGYNHYVEKENVVIQKQIDDWEKNPPVQEPSQEDECDEEDDGIEIDNKPKLMEKLPYIVVIIDELADLMMVASQEVETTICRLAQMARATGIHLVIATQRPSVNVVTGLIKANVPSRIAFCVQSQIDSRTILDMGGAEKLLGKGDMLYMPVGVLNPRRVQGVFVSEKEVKAVVGFVKKQAKPTYLTEILAIEPLEDKKAEGKESGQDVLYEQAKEIVESTRYASTSFLQRKLRVGYNRAARLMDELEEEGVIGAYDAEKKTRTVLS